MRYVYNMELTQQDKARYLKIGMEMLEEQPVLWAIIRGRASILNIGLLIGQPRSRVERDLNQLIKANIVLPPRAGSTSYTLNSQSRAFDTYMNVRDTYYSIERTLLVKCPESTPEKGRMSSQVWRELKYGVDEKVMKLTAIQDKNFELISRLGRSFSVLDYARVRGKRKVDLYSKRELEAFRRLGLLEGTDQDTRITDEGRAYLDSRKDGLVPKGTAGLDLSSLDDLSAEENTQGRRANQFIDLLRQNGPMTTRLLSAAADISRSGAHKVLSRMVEAGTVTVKPLPDGSSQWALK